MKKIILISLAIIWGCSAAEAQKTTKKLRFGFLAGVNQAETNFYESQQSDKAQSFALGVDLSYRLAHSATLHFQPSWLKFNSYQEGGYNPYSRANLTFTVLKFPILFQYSLTKSKRFSPIVEAGIAYNRLNNSSITGESVFCGIVSCSDYSFGGKLNRSSKLSVLGGVGVNINMGKVTIPILLRYEYFHQGLEFYYGYNDVFGFGSLQYIASPLKNLSLTAGILF